MNNKIFFDLYSLAHQSVTLDWLIVFCANNFGYAMVFLAFVFLFLHTDGVFDYKAPFLQFKNKIKEIALVFSSAIAAYIFEYILKTLMPAPRPFIYFHNIM
jgi:hypothetical protein